MQTITITCDKCGLLIEPLSDQFQGRQIAGGGSLSTLSYTGVMGHNGVPPDGWHFHYLCFIQVVSTIEKCLIHKDQFRFQ